MPRGNVRSSQLITAATAMTEKAEIYKDVLVENGLPSDFLEQLKGATEALKGSIDGRGLARASRAAATQGVKSELALGRRVVAILDAVVTRLLRSDPVKLAEWNQLKRVTVKGVAVPGPAGLVATDSSGAQTSPTPLQTSPTQVVAASTTAAKAA